MPRCTGPRVRGAIGSRPRPTSSAAVRGSMGTTAAGAVGLSLLATDGGAGEVLTPARVFASPDLSGPTARGVQMAPDGSAVTWLKSKPSDVTVTDLWIADVADGTSRLL